MSKKIAKLISINRGFGGDTAIYQSNDGQIVVAVSWALMTHYSTAISINGEAKGEFQHPDRYIQPAEALSILGYEVHGTVDFAAVIKNPNMSMHVGEFA